MKGLNPLIMCKEGSCVKLGQEGVAPWWGGAVWNTLKGSRTEKRGGETKILKRGDKLGQGVGALKRGELEPPYELWITIAF